VHTRTHTQASYFAFVVSLRLFFSLPTTITSFPSSLHTHTHYYMQRIIRGPVVLLALLLTSAFSLYILLLLQSLFAITYTADGDEHTQSKAKQSRAPYTHIHDRYSVCASCLKKEARRESRDIHTYIHTYIYIRHVRAFSLAVDSSF
jgi:hypothetical protein